jgi:hypothetical protein
MSMQFDQLPGDADGQTGSGKTFTMYGKRDDPNLWGIAPRAMKELFDVIERDSGTAYQ